MDVNNRQLHTEEIGLIEKLAKEKAKAECRDASCEARYAIAIADAMERSAKGLVDNKEYAKNMAYLQKLVQASSDPNSEGARGELQSYLTRLQTAESMLKPYMGTLITVRGIVMTGDGAPQSYFGATPSQRSDPYLNDVLGMQPPGSVMPGVETRDQNRLDYFAALNGSAQKEYWPEEWLLGGKLGITLSGTFGRWWAGADVALAGKVSSSAGGNLSASKITEESMALRLLPSEQAVLAQIGKLPNTTLQGDLREYVTNSYFMRNGFTSFEGKCGTNCFDGVYVKGDLVYINEVKPLNANGSIKLTGANSGTKLDAQMTDEWISGAIKRLNDSGDETLMQTAALLTKAKNSGRLVKMVTGVGDDGAVVIKLTGGKK